MNSSVASTEVPIEWVEESNRLDAGYFSQEGIEARVLLDEIEEEGVHLDTIGDLTSRLFKKPRFKRDYCSRSEGEPYLTPTDMFMFPIKERKYVKNPPDELKSNPGWILITRSGTVGRTIVSNKFLSEYILSDDLIRAVPQEGIGGYLYAYLNSWIGQALLSKDEFGSAIKHIDPHQLEEVRIPRFPEVEPVIQDKIEKVNTLREDAHRLLEEAEEQVYSDCSLDRVSQTELETLGDTEDSDSFNISYRNLEKRFDASYHTPSVHAAINQMEESEKQGIGRRVPLKKLAESFVPPRFTRIYVDDPSDGVPMLQGSHVDQIEPQGLQYIWEEMDNLDRYIIEEDMILVTCSGTVGDTCLVSEKQDGWAATNHLIRAVPNDSIHPGYLTAFLISEYGQVQFERLTYGGVVDEIGESGELVDDLTIFVPDDSSIEEEIGEKVKEAYSKRDTANELENEAIADLESHMASFGSPGAGEYSMR